MSFLKPKLVLLALMCALPPALASSGCSGSAFTGSGDNSAGTSSSAGASSSAGSGTNAGTGTGGGVAMSCNGPEDCDDKNVCTLDRCNPDGACDASPRCPGSEKCCTGECAQCCDDADCDDGVACTTNTCFAGQCMFVPNDTSCAPGTEYCDLKTDCQPRKACTGLAGEALSVCDDGAPCTADACVDNFCQHAFCTDLLADKCCEGIGCAACCNDSQCETDKDPCTVGSCEGGKCSEVALCGKDQQCCPSADGLSATCGSCCNAVDCDDHISCTKDQCGGNTCSNTPSAELCDPGYLCDVKEGEEGKEGKCVKAPACTENTDCNPSTCQSNGKCLEGACHFDDCAAGTTCCANGSGCGACCADTECDDFIPCTKDVCGATGCTHSPDSGVCGRGYTCNVTQGCVQTCNADVDCNTNVITTAVIGLPSSCTTNKCVKGQCMESTVLCATGLTCCPETGTCTLPKNCLATQ